MEFYSVEHWQKNWEQLIERVENGETIGVKNDKGVRAVFTPIEVDEMDIIYKYQNNEAS
tara:strand:+ start:534 stop:710 length:177 start_codon:yes stop_codon:yes gene_type:complete